MDDFTVAGTCFHADCGVAFEEEGWTAAGEFAGYGEAYCAAAYDLGVLEGYEGGGEGAR